MSIRRMLALALRIVRQFVRDRRTLALLFLAPLLVMTLLNFVLNSSSGGATLGVVAPDGPAGATVMSQITSQLSGRNGLSVTTVARDQVDATLKSGDADGVLIFPADISGLTSGLRVQLRLDGSNPTAAQQLRALVAQLVARLSPTIPSAAASPPPAAPAISSSLDVSY